MGADQKCLEKVGSTRVYCEGKHMSLSESLVCTKATIEEEYKQALMEIDHSF